ncbi:MAG: M23 family metallopeptidase [Rhodothermia bacterium]|nr:MAG: M23 family metallopeptidase [Rhodothermia bacterium]
MAKNSYYYYDNDACCFIEVKETRSKIYSRTLLIIAGSLALSIALTLGMDRFVQTPQELALTEENDALQQQLADVSDRISAVSDELLRLGDLDQSLYRTLLQTDPISEDIRQVGVGGTDPFPEFRGFSPSTSALLEQTSSQLGQLERQVGLQNASYRELVDLAREREVVMAEMPAIIPTEGPIISGFGVRFHPVLKVDRMHNGVDILVRSGTPVVSAADGVILQVSSGSGLGILVKVQHPNAGYVTVYGHLSKVATGMRRGKKVSRGEIIGYSGNTGLTSGPHLHYEVRDVYGKALNPVFFLAPSMTPATYQKLVDQTERTTISLD